MATIRDGAQSVLVVIDVQNGVMAAAWDAPRIIGNVATAVGRARDAGAPVVWVQHADDELLSGSEPWQIVRQLTPAPDEPVIAKHHNSAFEQTELDEVLDDLGSTHLVLAGAATNWCVRSTAYGALERGYDVTLVSDAHTTESMELDGARVEAADVVAELNTTLRGVSYPGRATATIPSSEIEFAGSS